MRNWRRGSAAKIVGHDETFGKRIQHLLQIGARADRPGVRRERREAHEAEAGVFLPEQGTSHQQFGLAVGKAHAHVGYLPRDPDRPEHGLDRQRAFGIEKVGKGTARDPLGRQADQLDGSGIGLRNLLGSDIDDQDRLGCELEEKAVARLGRTDALIFALHRLLGVCEALLKGGSGAQVAADGYDSPIPAHAEFPNSAQEGRRPWATDNSPAASATPILKRPRPAIPRSCRGSPP